MYVCMYVCLYVCGYAYISMQHVCVPACLPACMHACRQACMYVCMHVCMYACMFVCRYMLQRNTSMAADSCNMLDVPQHDVLGIIEGPYITWYSGPRIPDVQFISSLGSCLVESDRISGLTFLTRGLLETLESTPKKLEQEFSLLAFLLSCVWEDGHVPTFWLRLYS